ncbi:MAG TPA: glycosyltransferase [Candidatus Hydrogenedentes bacterium]|nr:glycosyltransferase [Candidatus Hydrogenedentota bacterium]HNT86673.1 glycosyltransferase [Candidatus Hydrogenedentota bacterium]
MSELSRVIMKILHVYKDFYPPIAGGMERHIGLMCRFQRQWAEVEALVCSRTPRTRVVERDGTRVTEAGEWGRFQSAPISPTFPWHLRRMRADVVVIHVPNPTAELSWLLARPRGRLVVRYHSDVVRQARAMRVYRPVLMHFLRHAAVIIPTSQAYIESSPILGELRERCRVAPLGILPEEFAAPDPGRVETLRARYGGDYVLFSGRHRYYKGLPYLVRAARAIRAKVVIAGDGAERAASMALARELGADIAFPGELSHEDLVAHLHGCAVFVFPSVERSEAFGISILEAHACGKPVVATRLGTGVEYANLDGLTGLNVSPRDPEALAEAVNALLEDSARRERMGAYAAERVRREFHAETAARAEFALFQEVWHGHLARD